MLMKPEDVATRIKAGQTLYLAGDQALLERLPRGNWIGGTIPYFMDSTGGTHSRDLIFVSEQGDAVSHCTVRHYPTDALERIPSDSPDHGFSVIIIPAGSEAHVQYAQNAPGYPGLFLKNLIGWVAGVDLDELGKAKAMVFDGITGQSYADGAVVLHAELPEGKQASVGIVNCFEQGRGDVLTFPSDGFVVGECQVNGEPRKLSEYLAQTRTDVRLPLVADYNGAMVNVSIQGVDEQAGTVSLYAPVFAGVEYRLASPVQDYVEEFSARLPRQVSATKSAATAS